jgi:hypothetical protein
MRYLTTNQDDTVAVIVLIPVAVIRVEDGERFALDGLRVRDPAGDQPGSCTLYGAGVEVVIGDYTYDVADLEADSIAGLAFVFPDVERDVIAKWVPATRDQVVGVRQCTKAEIPADRTFRNAWRDRGRIIDHDMPMVRQLQLGWIRQQRAPMLEQLDRDWMRATGQGNSAEAARIEAERQRLRDAPATLGPLLEAAQTPDDVKRVTI